MNRKFLFLGLNYDPVAARFAHRSVKVAVRLGRLLRSDHCEQCGKQVKPTRTKKNGRESKHFGSMEPHHEDYARPLHVVWLCGTCHLNRHFTAPDKWIWSAEAAARLAQPDPEPLLDFGPDESIVE